MSTLDAHTAVGLVELEEAMADGWWPLEHAWLGRWLQRASAGFTGRGNSTLPLGDPGVPLAVAVDRVEAFYRSRDLRPRFAVPSPVVGDVSAGPLVAELQRRGYAAETPTVVMTAPTAAVARDTDVQILERPDDAWLSVYRYRDQPLPPAAGALLVSAQHQRFAAVVDGGETVAVGRVAVSRGWGGITAMQVAGSHRGRGLARDVLAALAAHALSAGATGLYLQVALENTAARTLYASAGFADHHGYHYRLL